MGGDGPQRKIRGVRGGLNGGGSEQKSVGALNRQKMTSGGERGQFIFHPDILGTWTQCRRLPHLGWNQPLPDPDPRTHPKGFN